MVTKIIDQQHLKAVCDALAETNLGYTTTELTRLLQQSEIEILSDGKSSNAYGYTLGLNKPDWLYNCLASEINKSHSLSRVYFFFRESIKSSCLYR